MTGASEELFDIDKVFAELVKQKKQAMKAAKSPTKQSAVGKLKMKMELSTKKPRKTTVVYFNVSITK